MKKRILIIIVIFFSTTMIYAQPPGVASKPITAETVSSTLKSTVTDVQTKSSRASAAYQTAQQQLTSNQKKLATLRQDQQALTQRYQQAEQAFVDQTKTQVAELDYTFKINKQGTVTATLKPGQDVSGIPDSVLTLARTHAQYAYEKSFFTQQKISLQDQVQDASTAWAADPNNAKLKSRYQSLVSQYSDVTQQLDSFDDRVKQSQEISNLLKPGGFDYRLEMTAKIAYQTNRNSEQLALSAEIAQTNANIQQASAAVEVWQPQATKYAQDLKILQGLEKQLGNFKPIDLTDSKYPYSATTKGFVATYNDLLNQLLDNLNGVVDWYNTSQKKPADLIQYERLIGAFSAAVNQMADFRTQLKQPVKLTWKEWFRLKAFNIRQWFSNLVYQEQSSTLDEATLIKQLQASADASTIFQGSIDSAFKTYAASAAKLYGAKIALQRELEAFNIVHQDTAQEAKTANQTIESDEWFQSTFPAGTFNNGLTVEHQLKALQESITALQAQQAEAQTAVNQADAKAQRYYQQNLPTIVNDRSATQAFDEIRQLKQQLESYNHPYDSGVDAPRAPKAQLQQELSTKVTAFNQQYPKFTELLNSYMGTTQAQLDASQQLDGINTSLTTENAHVNMITNYGKNNTIISGQDAVVQQSEAMLAAVKANKPLPQEAEIIGPDGNDLFSDRDFGELATEYSQAHEEHFSPTNDDPSPIVYHYPGWEPRDIRNPIDNTPHEPFEEPDWH